MFENNWVWWIWQIKQRISSSPNVNWMMAFHMIDFDKRLQVNHWSSSLTYFECKLGSGRLSDAFNDLSVDAKSQDVVWYLVIIRDGSWLGLERNNILQMMIIHFKHFFFFGLDDSLVDAWHHQQHSQHALGNRVEILYTINFWRFPGKARGK